jgi:tRNA (guanine37-N1)-methyltransferase
MARELAGLTELIIVCGRYEGIDERVTELCIDQEVSIGDFVLTGGELAAMVIVDAVGRLLPGVLGCDDSAVEESFSEGLLEYPQYTRPPEFHGLKVPEVLLSGNHQEIAKWRRQQAILRTVAARPELLANAQLTPAERKLANHAMEMRNVH